MSRKPRCKWIIKDPRTRTQKLVGEPIPVNFQPHNCQRPAWQDGFCKHHWSIIRSKSRVVQGYGNLQKAITDQKSKVLSQEERDKRTKPFKLNIGTDFF